MNNRPLSAWGRPPRAATPSRTTAMPTPSRYPLITYDATVDALAIQLSAAARTEQVVTRALTDTIRADYAGERLLAFEILDASAQLDPAVLTAVGSPREWLSMAEAVRLAKRRPTTLRSAIAQGRLEAEKHGRDWLISRRALTAYIENLHPAGRPTTNRRAPNRTRTKATTKTR